LPRSDTESANAFASPRPSALRKAGPPSTYAAAVTPRENARRREISGPRSSMSLLMLLSRCGGQSMPHPRRRGGEIRPSAAARGREATAAYRRRREPVGAPRAARRDICQKSDRPPGYRNVTGGRSTPHNQNIPLDQKKQAAWAANNNPGANPPRAGIQGLPDTRDRTGVCTPSPDRGVIPSPSLSPRAGLIPDVSVPEGAKTPEGSGRAKDMGPYGVLAHARPHDAGGGERSPRPRIRMTRPPPARTFDPRPDAPVRRRPPPASARHGRSTWRHRPGGLGAIRRPSPGRGLRTPRRAPGPSSDHRAELGDR
jgi:hypothetical protein